MEADRTSIAPGARDARPAIAVELCGAYAFGGGGSGASRRDSWRLTPNANIAVRSRTGVSVPVTTLEPMVTEHDARAWQQSERVGTSHDSLGSTPESVAVTSGGASWWWPPACSDVVAAGLSCWPHVRSTATKFSRSRSPAAKSAASRRSITGQSLNDAATLLYWRLAREDQ